MEAEFYLTQLKPLVGGKITHLVRTDKDDLGNEFFGLEVTFPNGKKQVVYFYRDDEGNAPGSFEIMDE